MRLKQLRYIYEVARNGLNVSSTAEKLLTSQPGISKQILQLERELGVPIFVRSGKQFTGITPAGEKIIALAGEILQLVENIRRVADEFRSERRGELKIATTHTQARYVLPPVVERFRQRYPEVTFQLRQGTPIQVAEQVARGDADLAIATEALDQFENLICFPCYRWNRCLLVPRNHPLTLAGEIELSDLSRYPIITYLYGFTGRGELDRAFRSASIQPNVVLTAADADVIKTYVRLGLGVGIVASMAYEPEKDTDLVAIDVGHLFEDSVTKVAIRRGAFVRGFVYDFLQLFAPHLERERVERALGLKTQEEVDLLFSEIELPRYGCQSCPERCSLPSRL